MNFLFTKKNKYMTNLLLTFIIIYFLILSFTYIFQRNLLYHPNENNYSGDELLVSVEKVVIKTSDNIELISWYHKKNENYKTILFLHGNAGTLENRIHKINHFKHMKVNFIILAWRGFSGNKGKPTEDGLYEDARSAIKWLKSNNTFEDDVILYGESLGTAVAVEVAQNKNFAGVILESPFTSMIDAGKNKYPFLPIKFLLKDKYESVSKIKNIKTPILIMHGKKDDLVPFAMGKKMYETANEPKYSYFSDYDNHMMNYDENLLKVLNEYIYSLN
tara:strand:+ start:139 stop:963 length:825 start_codon:yes stop_codon:yes gene_type:complete